MPNQMLPLQAIVDLRAMAMKGYSAFPKAPVLLKLREREREIKNLHLPFR